MSNTASNSLLAFESIPSTGASNGGHSPSPVTRSVVSNDCVAPSFVTTTCTFTWSSPCSAACALTARSHGPRSTSRQSLCFCAAASGTTRERASTAATNASPRRRRAFTRRRRGPPSNGRRPRSSSQELRECVQSLRPFGLRLLQCLRPLLRALVLLAEPLPRRRELLAQPAFPLLDRRPDRIDRLGRACALLARLRLA